MLWSLHVLPPPSPPSILSFLAHRYGRQRDVWGEGSSGGGSGGFAMAIHTSGNVLAAQASRLISVGSFGAAQELLQSALGRRPSDVDLLFQLGRCYEKGWCNSITLGANYIHALKLFSSVTVLLAYERVHPCLFNKNYRVSNERPQAARFSVRAMPTCC